MQQDNDKLLHISFTELKNVLFKDRKIICIATAVCFAFGLIYALTRPVEYIAEGTFRDKAKANNGLSSIAGFFSGGNAQENNAIALMKSRTVREDLAKTLNFQAILRQNEGNRYLTAIWHNIKSECNQFFNPYYLSLNDKNYPIAIKNVIYNDENPSSLTLHFLDEQNYEVTIDGKKNLGTLDTPFVHNGFSFTIHKLNSDPLKNQIFTVQLESLQQTVKNISDNLTIDQDRTDKNLLNIKFKNKNRHTATLAVNTLMQSYKNFLQTEQDQVIRHQINYLEKRQSEIGKKLQHSMESHVLKISDDIKNIGFPNTNLAMEFLTESQNSLQKKLLEIEFELKRLQNSKQAGYVYYDTYSLPGDPAIINQMLSEMRGLKKQKTHLKLNLQDFKGEKTQEFQGIDLKTSQDLFVSYTHKLNEIESQMMQNKFIISKMNQEDFELSSLGTILNDQISLDMSTKATLLAMNLKDSNNRSLKEQERIKEDLDLQKRFLSTHLENANQLLSLNENLMNYKVKSLQNMTLGLVKQQISLLQGNLTEYIESRIHNLKAEAEIIEQHKLALMNQMSALPSKWVSERMINLEMEVNQKMVEEVSKLVETKNISSNLEIIQSTVIDEAKAPIHPKSSRPFLFAILGSMIGALFSSTFLILRDLIKREKQKSA